MYSIFVETLKRMLADNAISIHKVKSLYDKKTITLEEYEYIIGKEDK